MAPMTDRPVTLARLRTAALQTARWCAVASLFMVPINKPATNVALGLCILLSAIGIDSRERWRNALRHPFVRGALVWWGVLMLSALHAWYLTSQLPLKGSFVWACWYPLALGSVLDDDRWRQRALIAFAAAMAMILLLSCGMAADLIPQRALVQAQPHMRDTVSRNTRSKAWPR